MNVNHTNHNIPTLRGIQENKISENHSFFTIQNIPKGRGLVRKNALRHTLMTCIPGVAAARVCIEGVGHEYSKVPGVVEDMTYIISNLRKMPISVAREFHDTKMLHIILPPTEGYTLTCEDLPVVSGVKFPVKDYTLFKMTGTNPVDLRVWFACGRSIDLPTVVQKKLEEVPLAISEDTIPIDIKPNFSPIQKTPYIQCVSVKTGDKEFDQLVIEIETDGSMTAAEAFNHARDTMDEENSSFCNAQLVDRLSSTSESGVTTELLERPIMSLSLNFKMLSEIEKAGLKRIGDLVNISHSQIEDIPFINENLLKTFDAELTRLHPDLGIKLLKKQEQDK